MSERLDSSARQSQETTFTDPGPQIISGQNCQGGFWPFSTIFKRPLFMHAKVLIHNNTPDNNAESTFFPRDE